MNRLLVEDVVLDNKIQNILIENGIIKQIKEDTAENKIWKKEKENLVEEIIKGNGKYVIPGFINMHTHSAMTLMRGLSEDESLHKWLDAIWKVEAKLDDELLWWGTKLACLEMIKTGTTTFNDQYWRIPVTSKAIEEMGLRGIQSFIFLNHFDKEKAEIMKRECVEVYEAFKASGRDDVFAVSVHAVYTVDAETIKWASNFVRRNNLLLHIHLAETQKENDDCVEQTGMSPTAYLEKLGVLGPEVLAAHCVWVSEDDIKILAKHNVKVVHNVNSNLKLASGYKFKYKEMKDAGITVCLGTDGAASSNNLDMLEAMKTSALLQKAWRRSPQAMPLNELMDCATVNGAKSLRINAGVVQEGFSADFSLVDVDNYAFVPNINFLANLIYSANSSCIDTVICKGRVLMRERKVEGEEEILENVKRIYKRLI